MKTRGIFDYELPQSLIAQTPVEPRDSSRLLVYHATGMVEHKTFRTSSTISTQATPWSSTRPASFPPVFYGVKEGTGGAIEFLSSYAV